MGKYSNFKLSYVINCFYFIFFFHNKEDRIFFATGSILGPLLEIICINLGGGIWIYNNPAFFGIPLWLPIMWGFIFLITRRIRDVIFKMEHKQIHYYLHHKIKNNLHFLIFDISIYILIIILAINLWENNLLLFIILLIILILLITDFHDKEDIFFIVFSGTIAPILEFICISEGAWFYQNPTIFQIPLWLPIGYCIFAVIVRRASVIFLNYLYADAEKISTTEKYF